MDSKPIILAIAGESGSGKTQAENFLISKYDVSLIPSYTTRNPREGDVGYVYVDDDEYRNYFAEDFLTFKNWKGIYYYSLVKDVVEPVNIRVAFDESIEYMKNNFSDLFTIVSLRLQRDKHLRSGEGIQKRIQRDKDTFYLPPSYFDHVITNNYTSLKPFFKELKNTLDYILEK